MIALHHVERTGKKQQACKYAMQSETLVVGQTTLHEWISAVAALYLVLSLCRLTYHNQSTREHVLVSRCSWLYSIWTEDAVNMAV